MQTIQTPYAQQTVANLVLEHSECAQVFKRHHIDFCCRGDMSIEEAAKQKGLDVTQLVDELALAIAQRLGEQGDPRLLTTRELVTYIVSRHHEYLREVLPFVRGLASKVSSVHGEHNPKLRDLHTAVYELDAALIPHLDEEEQALFPALTATQPDMERVRPQLADMMHEHLAVASLLERIQAATDNFTLPDWACNSYRTLFAELQQLQDDVFTHVHLENHVLKPRFVARSTQ
jgi:regulator of cell morphogenesis and NO signaling